MFRSAILASVCAMLVASAALAEAPSSLMKGNWSLGFTASADPTILFGYQIKDMFKVGGGFGVASLDPGDTAWNITAAGHYYLAGKANQYFAPFLGGGVGYSDSGVEGSDGTLELNARFGAEAFPVPPLSVGGWVGFGWSQLDSDTDSIGTIRSEIFVNLYW